MSSFKGTARAVLQILGFKGFRPFAAAAGVHHETAMSILYQYDQRRGHISSVARVYETLRSAYGDRKDQLSLAERRFIENWIKKWSASAVKYHVAAQRTIANPCRKLKIDRRLRKKRREATLKAITRWASLPRKDIPRVD